MRKNIVDGNTGVKILFKNPLTNDRKYGKILFAYDGLAWNVNTQKAEPTRYFHIKWSKGGVGRVGVDSCKVLI